jgi:hypothetical protein
LLVFIDAPQTPILLPVSLVLSVKVIVLETYSLGVVPFVALVFFKTILPVKVLVPANVYEPVLTTPAEVVVA